MSEIFEEPETDEEEDDEELEDGEEEEDIAEPSAIAEGSLEEILSKRGEVADVEEEEEALLDLTPDERMETLSIRP
ncbi:MAG: hypothetical protein JWM17_1798, partial [Actinobacteria bacterium]|nr:hypothetical protein [Actinomycetota bacterium]